MLQLLHKNKAKTSTSKTLALEKQPINSIFFPLALARCKGAHKDYSITGKSDPEPTCSNTWKGCMAMLAEPTAALKLLVFPHLLSAPFLLPLSENCVVNKSKACSTVADRNYPHLPL